MNLIDRIIQEWSYRTDKGYPDVNSKEDVELFESVFGINIKEGARVEYDQGDNPVSITLKNSNNEDEQLFFEPAIRTTSGYTIYYSLVGRQGEEGIKVAMDALKHRSELIKGNELIQVVKSSIPTNNSYTDIAVLESSAKLNNKLTLALKEIYPQAKLHYIEKIKYDKIDDSVDWERFRRESEKIKAGIINFLYKTAEKEGPYPIKKTGSTQSSIIARLHSKYDIGNHPYFPDKSKPEIYQTIVKVLQGNGKLLIVDDNLHSGTDFAKIFNSITDLKEKIENKMLSDFSEIDPILGKLPGDRTKEEREIVKVFYDARKRISRLVKNPRNSIDGYVLYRINNEDLKSK